METYSEANWPDAKIHHLVMATDDFIVFIDKEMDVDWQTKVNHKDLPDQTIVKKFNEIINLAARVESIPSDHHARGVRLKFKRMIGEAIARSLVFDCVNAKNMLAAAERYINERNAEQSRFWYLLATGSTSIIISILGFIFWLNRVSVICFVGQTAFFIMLASSAGAMGALLSVIMRLGNASLDSAAGRELHFLEGFFRIVAGCISALLISLCVRLDLLVSIFTKVEHTHIAMLLAGIIAGASERWAPSLIGKIDSHKITNSTQNADHLIN